MIVGNQNDEIDCSIYENYCSQIFSEIVSMRASKYLKPDSSQFYAKKISHLSFEIDLWQILKQKETMPLEKPNDLKFLLMWVQKAITKKNHQQTLPISEYRKLTKLKLENSDEIESSENLFVFF